MAAARRAPGAYNLAHTQAPSQTLGPFFHQGLLRGADFDAAMRQPFDPSDPDAEPIVIVGRVLDGLERPVGDALVELWQADSAGVYHHPLDPRHGLTGSDESGGSPFAGYARVATDAEGRYQVETIRPGAAPGPGGTLQAPHISVLVGARGMMRHAFTRIYFEGDALLSTDWVLSQVSPERRSTLVATLRGGSAATRGERAGGSAATYRFDVRLQGARETVFFDL